MTSVTDVITVTVLCNNSGQSQLVSKVFSILYTLYFLKIRGYLKETYVNKKKQKNWYSHNDIRKCDM